MIQHGIAMIPTGKENPDIPFKKNPYCAMQDPR
jgi:hypothetical protein